LVPFTPVAVAFFLIIIFLLGLWLLSKNKLLNSFWESLLTHRKIFIFQELLFFAILTAWSFVRGFAPDIEGLEKFMDWGFVNSALRGKYMPPLDMWFASLPINYYYFGHLETAVMAKLTSIDTAIVYNLAIASACATTFTHTFSLASNLVASLFKKENLKLIILGGLISAIVLTFGGNFHPVYKIASNIIKNEGSLKINRQTVATASQSYWYPDATRFIGFDPDVQDKTIHEFPLYSFVVADLHGHMNDIPNVLLFLAVLFSVAGLTQVGSVSWRLVLPSAFLLSVAYMTNAWDFAVYGMFFAIFIFMYNLHRDSLKSALLNTINNGLLTIIIWYVLTLPFSLNFTPMAEGLKLTDMRTPFYQLFILYGGFWLIVLPFVATTIRQIFIKRLRPTLDLNTLFVLALIITATILIIIPEIGYIKDIYIYEHRRANTMFKLVYQAFIIYSLVSGYILVKFRKQIFVKALIILVIAIHLIYPFFSISSFYSFHSLGVLWGLGFMVCTYKVFLEYVRWINKNITGQPVILEAVGDSYTTFNQVSVATGLPTVEGWIVHEWLWRGGYEQPSARQVDVQNIYEAKSANDARALLQKYSVKYVFLGDKEREKYPALNPKIFDELGAKVIFESGQTRVLELN
jgi:uncharacterized membrane protein